MGKKKREHIVFDQMLKQKKSISFTKVNTKTKSTSSKNKKAYEYNSKSANI